MNLRISLIVLCLFVTIGCRKTSTPAPAAPPTAPGLPTSQLNHPAGGSTPAAQVKYFKGSIGSSLDLQMKLMRSGDQLSGSYFYQKVGTKIDLRGNVDKDGNLTLEEFDPSGKQTGVFKGIWKVDPQDGLATLAGNWSKPPNEKGSDKKTAFSVHEEPIAFTGGVELTSKQIKESNRKLMYEVAAQYPQLIGGNNPNFEKFNEAARASVTKKVAEFKKNMAESKDEPKPEGSMGSDIDISYAVALAQDDLISIKFDVGSYYQGAAHPNSFSEVINYDLKNGKQLKLSDLFKPGAKYLQAISAYCIAELKKQLDAPEGGAAPVPKNYQSWNITKQGLGINFDSYQVASYAEGPQYVLVPYSKLKDLINPDGPIGQFVK
ncbi:MAG TPA: RsiV family protein [Pyrinomonadaceae bacterium]|nr:RsiV family protein [Pyrinomonadaceae bacterium]